MCKARRGYAQRCSTVWTPLSMALLRQRRDWLPSIKAARCWRAPRTPAPPMAKFQRETLGITEAVQYNSDLVYNNMVLGAKAALADGVPVRYGHRYRLSVHHPLQYVA